MSEKPHSPSDGPGHGHEGHHGPGHHGSVFIQHHYDDAQHQFDSGKLGIWLFLAQEVLFFSALFVAYVLYRHHHGEIYAYAHKYLDVKYGAINTAVLIFSSLTAAWAVRAAQLRQKTLLVACIALTIACALGFLGIKYIEYTHKVHEHILFGKYFDPCVSSGGRPLLTRNNKCGGHESSVVWNSETASARKGCFPDFAIDQDPKKDGVQASCGVDEVKIHYTFKWATGGGPEKEEGPFFPQSKCTDARTPRADARDKKLAAIDKQIAAAKQKLARHEAELKKKEDTAKKSNTSVAPDDPDRKQIDDAKKQLTDLEAQKKKVSDEERVSDCIEHETPQKQIMEQCPEWRPSSQPQLPVKYPCWRPGFQPEVCTVSYAFTFVDGAETKFAGPFSSEDACRKEQKAKAESMPQGPAPGTCTRTNTIGIIVEYGPPGTHTLLADNLRVKAECKGPPPAAPSNEDPLADKEQRIELGKPVATGLARETKYDAIERLHAGPPPEHTNMFFTIYFAMTGLHGIHVLVGVFVFIWLLIRAIKGHFTPDYFGPVDFAALYWHIVDLIWIFLFPLLYLIH